MKEYIERAAALDTIGVQNNRIWNEVYDLPASDVAPVRHGRWIGEEIDIGGHVGKECSECHKVRIIDEYCSACGARMDKEDDHD